MNGLSKNSTATSANSMPPRNRPINQCEPTLIISAGLGRFFISELGQEANFRMVPFLILPLHAPTCRILKPSGALSDGIENSYAINEQPPRLQAQFQLRAEFALADQLGELWQAIEVVDKG